MLSKLIRTIIILIVIPISIYAKSNNSEIVNANQNKSINYFYYYTFQTITASLAGSAVGLVGAISIHPIVGWHIGYTIGTSLGVKYIGETHYPDSQYWPALAGSIMGTAIGLSIYYNNNQKNNYTVALFVFSPLMSTIGYNLFKDSKLFLKTENHEDIALHINYNTINIGYSVDL